MPIKVIVQFQAQPGKRAQLRSLLESIASTHGPSAAGFVGSTVFETLDSDDGLVEIADWESIQAQAAAVQQATARGVYAPVVALVAAPFTVTRLG
jgi:quinol monooxygenase YgiN